MKIHDKYTVGISGGMRNRNESLGEREEGKTAGH